MTLIIINLVTFLLLFLVTSVYQRKIFGETKMSCLKNSNQCSWQYERVYFAGQVNPCVSFVIFRLVLFHVCPNAVLSAEFPTLCQDSEEISYQTDPRNGMYNTHIME